MKTVKMKVDQVKVKAYTVTVEEVLQRTLVVNAADEDDAVRLVTEMYNNEEIVLDYDDLVNASIYITGNKESEESTITFTSDEFKFIAGRIFVESEWGASVYDNGSLEIIKSILAKMDEAGIKYK